MKKVKSILFDGDSFRVLKDLGRTYRLWVHKVFSSFPLRGSWAEMILLQEELSKVERDSWADRAKQTKDFRSSDEYKALRYQMFDENKKANGGEILCSYCGRKCNRVHEDPNQATIDHVIPLSSGGAGLDPNNLIVCCRRCNRAKRYFDGDIEDYKKIRTAKRIKEEKK